MYYNGNNFNITIICQYIKSFLPANKIHIYNKYQTYRTRNKNDMPTIYYFVGIIKYQIKKLNVIPRQSELKKTSDTQLKNAILILSIL